MAPMEAGHATAEGTARYAARSRLPGEHFRGLNDSMLVSSLGVGTYLGLEDAATDLSYQQAVRRALDLGVNVIDTAVNYRHQRSERAIGAALAEAIKLQGVRRDEVVVATKGGFIPLDAAARGDTGAYFTETYLKTGIIRPGEVVAGSHCMTPRYLADQIERSRTNLGLETLDVYYLHNPETQLAEVERPEFMRRVREAFETFEQAAADGKIRCYGIATWNGYRDDPSSRHYLSLVELVAAAQAVGGAGHHLRVIQVPYNLAMPEAFTRANQRLDGQMVSTLEAARRLGLYVMVSASVYQGQLTRNLPAVVAEYLPGLETDAQRALQFVRSTPGVGTALVGMKSVAHVVENTGVSRVTPVAWEEFKRLFSEA